ncbi:MAG: FapA family protein [Gemmatimonadales bacterium]|nr:FapA family protein [Gemmatimonadales bacterium]
MSKDTQSPLMEKDSGEKLESSGEGNGHPASDHDFADGADGVNDKALPTGPPEYELRISRDKITVRLDCPDVHGKLSTHVARILADFEELEIPEYPDNEQLTSILTEVCVPGEHLRNHVLIMGVEPTPTVNGRLDWSRDFFLTGWEMNETTQVMDFWQKLEDRSVKKDELLVSLHDPVPGEPGLNVFGTDIPVDKPVKVKLRCGKGVRTEEHEDRVDYHSTYNGRIRFADGTVSVDEVYAIKGDVSLETGNIKHTGAVIIEGDIGTGATVEADGDIIVKGMAETCTICCGGTLTVAGGILGSDEYQIKVEGDLNAKYIGEAVIFAKGDVTACNEIAHSEIRTLGRITVEKGRIAGGTVVARRGIRIAEAGAGGAVTTHLAAGVDYTLREKENSLTEKMSSLEETKQKVADAITKVRRGPEASSPKGRNLLADLSGKMQKIDAAMGQIFTALETLTREAEAEAVEEIIILEKVWSGTLIQLGDAKLNVKTSIHKPRLAQRKRTKVRLFPLGEGNMPDE